MLNSRPRIGLFLILASMMWTLTAGSVLARADRQTPAADKTNSNFAPGQILVGYDPHVEALSESLSAQFASHEIETEFSDHGIAVVSTPPGEELAQAVSIAKMPGVLWAEPNYYARALGEPNDPRWPDQWWHHTIDTAAAWDIVQGDSGVVVAIVDTGVDLDHPDLGRLWDNSDEFPANGLDDDGNGKIDDIHGWHWYAVGGGQIGEDANIQMPSEYDPARDTIAFHGMHVAGIFGAAADNAEGVAGVARGPQIMVLRALDQFGLTTYAIVAAAIYYAVDNDADIINLSLGGPSPSQTLTAAINYALERDVLVVAASGNSGGAVYFPAAMPGVVAVGGTAADDALYARSSRGPQLDIVAPAVDILSTWASSLVGGYFRQTGTSMATPQVTGVLALLKSLRPNAAAAQLQQWLYDSALDLGAPGRDDLFGWGRLRARGAAQAAAEGLTLSVVASGEPVAAGTQALLVAEIRDESDLLSGSGIPITITISGGLELALTEGGQVTIPITIPLEAQAGDSYSVTVSWNGQSAVAAVVAGEAIPLYLPLIAR
ncbi:MAG: S8 family serine peptidase [Caldilineales bacterium]|nr:S8 family serine peptidase [Caldilineales bacterium]